MIHLTTFETNNRKCSYLFQLQLKDWSHSVKQSISNLLLVYSQLDVLLNLAAETRKLVLFYTKNPNKLYFCWRIKNLLGSSYITDTHNYFSRYSAFVYIYIYITHVTQSLCATFKAIYWWRQLTPAICSASISDSLNAWLSSPIRSIVAPLNFGKITGAEGDGTTVIPLLFWKWSVFKNHLIYNFHFSRKIDKTNITTRLSYSSMTFFMDTKAAISTSISLSPETPNVIVAKEALYSSIKPLSLKPVSINMIKLFPTTCSSPIYRFCYIITFFECFYWRIGNKKRCNTSSQNLTKKC